MYPLIEYLAVLPRYSVEPLLAPASLFFRNGRGGDVLRHGVHLRLRTPAFFQTLLRRTWREGSLPSACRLSHRGQPQGPCGTARAARMHGQHSMGAAPPPSPLPPTPLLRLIRRGIPLALRGRRCTENIEWDVETPGEFGIGDGEWRHCNGQPNVNPAKPSRGLLVLERHLALLVLAATTARRVPTVCARVTTRVCEPSCRWVSVPCLVFHHVCPRVPRGRSDDHQASQPPEQTVLHLPSGDQPQRLPEALRRALATIVGRHITHENQENCKVSNG